MSTNPFAPAVRHAQKARILITGLDGSGKTYTAIELAHALGEKIAVIDTEYDRARLEADKLGPFDHMTLSRHEPRQYVEAIRAAVSNGYEVVVIDSLTHAWKAVLAAVDATTNSSGKQDGRQGWRQQRPEHDALVKAIIHSPIHVIATSRSKREIDWEDDKKRSLGLVPIADPEVRFEFDLVIDMDREHTGVVSKVRGCSFMDGRTERRPTRAFLADFKKWLDEGTADPALRARDLLDVVGAEGRDELTKAMKAAKIATADLSDDAKWTKAKSIADGIAALRSKEPTPEPASNGADPDNPGEDERRAELAAALPGQATLGDAA